MQVQKDNHENLIYQMIIVHSVLTIFANRRTKHVKFLSNLLFSPEAMKVYLHKISTILVCIMKGFSIACYAHKILKNPGGN